MIWALVLLGCKNEGNLDLIREPPVVAIEAPADGDLLAQDVGIIVLDGLVSDLPDAPEVLTLQWTLDGALHPTTAADPSGDVRSTLDLMAVEPGVHEIALSATDTDANTVTVAISIEVVAAAAAPIVEITAPADGDTFEADEDITFTGHAVDANDAGDQLVFQWTSSLDGPIEGATSGGGLSFVTTGALREGEHTIVLSATDSDGEVGQDAIVVTVGSVEPEDPEDPEPGEVIFSELMVNPSAVDDEIGEWVELYNTGGRWLDIGGYGFHDLDFDEYTLQGSILVPPNGYVVLCADLNPNTNGGAECDAWFSRLTEGGLALANVPDEVVLTRPDGTEIDRLVYGDEWVASGAAIGLDPGALTGTENDDFGNWCFQTTSMTGGDLGTPGAENDACP